MLYSGYENAASRGVTLRKPATQAALVETLARLFTLEHRPRRNWLVGPEHRRIGLDA